MVVVRNNVFCNINASCIHDCLGLCVSLVDGALLKPRAVRGANYLSPAVVMVRNWIKPIAWPQQVKALCMYVVCEEHACARVPDLWLTYGMEKECKM